jgi:NADH-quinone oxidoreductase subunit N
MDTVIQVPNFLPALPEIVLAIGAMALLMYGAFRGDRVADQVAVGAILLLILASAMVLGQTEGRTTTFGGAFVVDAFAKFFKVAVFLGSAVAILMSLNFFKREGFNRFEYPVLVLLAVIGMGMMISANDLIAVYVGLELMSLSLYVIAAINRDNLRSTEAGLKYFVLGALSSGLFLYGASLIYGFTGTTGFDGIAAAVQQGSRPSLGLVFGLVFVLAGFAFKVSAVPFHMWTPDVYEGAPTPVTAFFAAAPKLAAMALLVRAMIDGFPNAAPSWQQVIMFISIASMGLGAFAAIGQNNIKRLLAYSSIANVGFALVGLAAANESGVRGLLVYMIVYLAMTLGTFACVLAMRTREGMVEDVGDLSGLAKNNPGMAALLAVLMFSLIGLPPLAGFFGKYMVFLAAIEAQLIALAILGVLSSAIGAYYYLRVVKVMYFDEPKTQFEPMPGELKVVLGASAAFVLLFFLYPSPLYNAASAAAKSLF